MGSKLALAASGSDAGARGSPVLFQDQKDTVGVVHLHAPLVAPGNPGDWSDLGAGGSVMYLRMAARPALAISVHFASQPSSSTLGIKLTVLSERNFGSGSRKKTTRRRHEAQKRALPCVENISTGAAPCLAGLPCFSVGNLQLR